MISFKEYCHIRQAADRPKELGYNLIGVLDEELYKEANNVTCLDCGAEGFASNYDWNKGARCKACGGPVEKKVKEKKAKEPRAPRAPSVKRRADRPTYGDYSDHPEDGEYGDIDFADPGGRSALRAATRSNPRIYPCPNCKRPNMLTGKDVSQGYQCDICADAAEGGGY